MSSFLEELWTSIFTPGTTPTLLVATNASFAALQLVLLILLIATYSIHFFILSVLTAGLWYAINWFARELHAEKIRAEAEQKRARRGKSPETGSDTETDLPVSSTAAVAVGSAPVVAPQKKKQQPTTTGAVQAEMPSLGADLRRRKSLGDSSGYVSTDSEWEKVSEGDKKA